MQICSRVGNKNLKDGDIFSLSINNYTAYNRNCAHTVVLFMRAFEESYWFDMQRPLQ